MDRLGMLAMDENRDYGGNRGQGGNTQENVDDELVDMADLVKRDRSHPVSTIALPLEFHHIRVYYNYVLQY